jgi:TolB-like protein/DNA-binding winged helix-turn-helix (wHTH) protein
MSAAEPPSLVFGEITIDLAGHRLLRGGVPQPLEPKAFAVLALLAGAPGQAFGRDRILDAVWGHRHVTPGVLNRVMTLLRHALGEDAHSPRYLHTVHGVGYRFDPPAAAPPLPAQPPPEAPETAGAPTLASSDTKRHPAPAPAVAVAPQAEAAAPSGGVARRPRWQWWALAVAAIGLLGAAGWWAWSSSQQEAPAPTAAAAPATPTLIVMPLKPIGDGDRDIAAGLSDELISALARIEGLRVIARESTGLAAAQATDVAALVPRLGISHALEGSLRQSGERLRIRLRLIEAPSGRTLWAQNYDRDVVDVLAIERETANAVAAALTLRLGLPSAGISKGGDAEFLRRYHAARAMLRSNVSTEGLEQIEAEFRALVKLRPEDARTRAGLAFILEARAYTRPSLAQGLRAEALAEADLATRLDPNLPEPYEVRGGLACRQNQWERCLALYRKAIALGAGDSRTNLRWRRSATSTRRAPCSSATSRAIPSTGACTTSWAACSTPRANTNRHARPTSAPAISIPTVPGSTPRCAATMPSPAR